MAHRIALAGAGNCNNMATGIPITRSSDARGRATDSLFAPDRLSSAPMLRDDILAGRRAACETVWNPEDDRRRDRLYFGDNLPILRTLLDDRDVRGRIRLIYIDPPFASKSVYKSRSLADAYADALDGADYLDFMRRRFIVMSELLADNGSIYVHLDDRMVFHVKVMMDEIFGAENFRNLITRQKCHPKNYTRNSYGNVSDYILFYTKSDRYVWNRPMLPWTEKRKSEEYPCVERSTGRRYKRVPLHAPGVRNGDTGKAWKGINPPPGKHWQYRRETLDRLDAAGEIYWSSNGNPRRKVYADQSEGVPIQDIWMDVKDQTNQNARITGYPTEKNLDLLTRIVSASSNPGDLVMDCFAGSGTALEAAAKLGRAWIGIDDSIEAIDTIIKRLRFGLHRMGDFAQSRRSRSKTLDVTIHPPLFDTERDDQTHPLGGLRYEDSQKIKPDFSFLVSVDCWEEYVKRAKGLE